jgi:acyl carrier protein
MRKHNIIKVRKSNLARKATKTISMKDRVLSIINATVNEYLPCLPQNRSPDTQLIGTESGVTSLELVSFLVNLEEALRKEFNKPIQLMHEKAFSQQKSPFATLGRLALYVEKLVQDET